MLKHLLLVMIRKKWTPKTEITEDLIRVREKKKWQLALRRYVLEKKSSAAYAPYFGLDVQGFREWIEIQFETGLNWENFASAWQFEHVLPVTCFDFFNKEDMRLCWNFVNIKVGPVVFDGPLAAKSDMLMAKNHFSTLFGNTGYEPCRKLLEKIGQIENHHKKGTGRMESFINAQKEQITVLSSLNEEDFLRLNAGVPLKDLVLEKEILKKFSH
jgi:hypothetical protein